MLRINDLGKGGPETDVRRRGPPPNLDQLSIVNVTAGEPSRTKPDGGSPVAVITGRAVPMFAPSIER